MRQNEAALKQSAFVADATEPPEPHPAEPPPALDAHAYERARALYPRPNSLTLTRPR